MGEFKSLSFVVIDHHGNGSRVALNADEGKERNFSLTGDPDLLLRRWSWFSKHIENYLEEQVKVKVKK